MVLLLYGIDSTQWKTKEWEKIYLFTSVEGKSIVPLSLDNPKVNLHFTCRVCWFIIFIKWGQVKHNIILSNTYLLNKGINSKTVYTGDIKTSWDVPNLVHGKCQIKVNIHISHLLQVGTLLLIQMQSFQGQVPECRASQAFSYDDSVRKWQIFAMPWADT